MLLHRTLSGLNSSRASRKSLGDDLSAIKSLCAKVDVRGDFAGLHRVQCAGSSLWTTNPDGVNLIQEACNNYDFEQAMDIQSALESKLKSQEQLIKQLQEKIEIMTWHKELNLNVPETQNPLQKLSVTHSGVPKRNIVAPSLSTSSTTKAGESSPKKSVKETIAYPPRKSNLKNKDVLDVTSVATANSKSTFQDQISVD